MVLNLRTFSAAVLAALLGGPAIGQSNDDFDPFNNFDSEDLSQALIPPARTGGYVSGTFSYFSDFDFETADIFESDEQFELFIDDGVAVTAAIGAYIGDARIEFETGYFESDFDGFGFPGGSFGLFGDVSYLMFSGNLFYDFRTPVRGLDIYVGAGIGFAIIEAEADLEFPITIVDGFGFPITSVDEIDETFQTFTYQFLAGLSYRLLDNVTLTGGYRIRLFTEASSTEFAFTDFGFDLREHEISFFEIGLRIDF